MTEKKMIQGNDNIVAPPIYISEYDLQDEDIQDCINILGLEEVLYQIGFDKDRWYNETDTFYEVLECKHKTRTGKVVTGKRYCGYERLDSKWILEGLPSEEAKDASRKDRSYMSEIRNLSKRSR